MKFLKNSSGVILLTITLLFTSNCNIDLASLFGFDTGGGYCGDGMCDIFAYEDSFSCPQDCGTNDQAPNISNVTLSYDGTSLAHLTFDITEPDGIGGGDISFCNSTASYCSSLTYISAGTNYHYDGFIDVSGGPIGTSLYPDINLYDYMGYSSNYYYDNATPSYFTENGTDTGWYPQVTGIPMVSFVR